MSCGGNESSCAWVPVEGCLSSCDIIADTACFPAVDYNASEVCEQEAASGANVSNGDTSMPTSGGNEVAFSTATSSLLMIAASVMMLK